MKELSPFERHMKNWLKKQKQQQDQKILDEMLLDLKKKHEEEKKEKIQFFTNQLKKATG